MYMAHSSPPHGVSEWEDCNTSVFFSATWVLKSFLGLEYNSPHCKALFLFIALKSYFAENLYWKELYLYYIYYKIIFYFYNREIDGKGGY